MSTEDTLLALAKSLKDKPRPRPPTKCRADDDYVVPTTREMVHELGELFELDELVEPRGFKMPDKPTKKSMAALVNKHDGAGKVAERATLRRLLKAKKVPVARLCPTHEMVQLAMVSGCLGRENAKRAKAQS